MEFVLFISGIAAGMIAGLLGVGGGTVIVPILVYYGMLPIQAVATSSLAIIITSISGTLENFKQGNLSLKKILQLGIPASIFSQLGVWLANQFSQILLLILFLLLLLLNIYLVWLNQKVRKGELKYYNKMPNSFSVLFTGASAGILSGIFGVGGGIIMVPFQILFLKEEIKTAIQISLAVIILTAISSTIGHSISGNVNFFEGIIIGLGGAIGAQIGTRFLPKLSEKNVKIFFALFILVIIISVLWKILEFSKII